MPTERCSLEDGAPRPLRRKESTALVAFWNRCAPYDECTAGLLESKVWEDSDYHPSLTLVVVPDGRIRGFIMAVQRRSPETADTNGFIKLLAVDPSWRRQGLGSRLLEWAERRLAERGATRIRIAESAPDYLTPGVDVRYTAARSFFGRHGYRAIGTSCNMRAALAGQSFDTQAEEATMRSAGIVARRAGAADRAALNRLLDQFGGSWPAEVGRSMGHVPTMVHVAERDGRLLGFAACEGNNAGTGTFGPMGTLPAARGLGIGRLLLRRCLADLQQRGYRTATIPWVGPESFYARHAEATVSRKFLRLEKELT